MQAFPCPTKTTYGDALFLCHIAGARLCSAHELTVLNAAKGTGCAVDVRRVCKYQLIQQHRSMQCLPVELATLACDHGVILHRLLPRHTTHANPEKDMHVYIPFVLSSATENTPTTTLSRQQ